MIRLQNIAVNNESMQITYIEEADLHGQSGIMEARVLDIPHEVLPQALLDDVIDSAMQIIDHARAVRRQPVPDLRAPRP